MRKLACVVVGLSLTAGCMVQTEQSSIGDRVTTVYVVDARTGYCIEFGGLEKYTYRKHVSDAMCERVTK